MTKRYYGRFFTYKSLAQPPKCYKIAGIVYLSGVTPQQNAIVDLIDETDKSFVGQKLTDVNGAYSFDEGFAVRGDHTYHVTAEYDSGAQKYNSQSKPYITSVEN